MSSSNPESLPSTPKCPYCGFPESGEAGMRNHMRQFHEAAMTAEAGRIPTTNTSEVCDKAVQWWDGEYEAECVLAKGHAGNHLDSADSWFDDDGEQVDPPATSALQDEPEKPKPLRCSCYPDGDYRVGHGPDCTAKFPARPSAKRIELLKPQVHKGEDINKVLSEVFDLFHRKINELITAHNESQGKQE